MTHEEHPIKLAFLVLPGFPMACLTSAIEPLRAANEIVGRDVFEWLVVGEDENLVRCSAEVNFEPNISLNNLKACDGIYLLSSPTNEFSDISKTHGKLRQLSRNGTTIGAFSGGVFPLARSGILEGRLCSVHWVYEAAFKEQFPKVSASNRMMVRDGPFETASGAAAVFDLMLAHIGSAVDAPTVTEVACWFQHPFVRGSESAQLVPTKQSNTTQDVLPTVVKSAIEVFAAHISNPVRIRDVADAVGVSTRQLDRSFQKATGLGPLKYYRIMRLEQARQMVLYSQDLISDIALAVGYSSSEPMVKNYQRAFGMTPSQHRRVRNKSTS